MTFPKAKRSIIGLIVFLQSSTYALAGEASLRQDLLRLEDKLTTAQVSDSKNALGVQTHEATALFARAEASFRAREYLDVVRSLNQLLNASPRIDRYLEAQYYLGRSYEELHYPARSIKAYLRFLGSFASKNDINSPRLIEVIQRLLLLKEDMLAEEGETFDRLLASLIGYSGVPSAKRDEIKLLAAKSAYHANKLSLAEEWLNDLLKKEASPHTKADAQFYLGLIKLKTGSYDKSEELFTRLSEDSHQDHYFIQQLARLNLARLFAARAMPQHAWEWYQKVQGPGESQRLALYESVNLLMQSEDYPRAKQLAETYLKAYPLSKEAAYIKERMGFLQLSSGSFEDAESSLFSRQKELLGLNARLTKQYEGKFVIKDRELDELRQAVGALNIDSSVLDRAASLNHRLDKAKSAIQEHRQEVRSLQFTLGRIADSSLRPLLAAKDEQYWNYIVELSTIGEGMIDREVGFYQWTAAQQIPFVKAKERRKKILADQTMHPNQWKKTYQLALLENRASKLNARILKEQALLSAALYNGKHGTALQQDLSKQASDRQKELNTLTKKLQIAMEDQRALWVANYKNSSPLIKTKKHFLLLSQEFLENNSQLQQQRDHYPDPATKHIQEDFASNWQIWPRIAGKILVLMNKTEIAEQHWLDTEQRSQKTARDHAESLAIKETNLRYAVAKATGKAFPTVLQHVRYAIDEQAARGKKWLADVEWQRYLRETQEKTKQQAKQDLNEATIKENIRDTEVERALHE
ncbi:MAG: hypothetical protein H7249_03910 [Chitinophagaceae bacterium]|nr:hypothetical protein [Oligoflexus sp.]